MKHSKASIADISIQLLNNSIQLTVKDNGIGIRSENSGGFGMKNMKARVKALNGHLEIKSENQTGTEIVITFPV